MIKLNRLNGRAFVVNCELIKFVEATPDTLLTLTNGEKLMVQETVEQVVFATENYRKRLYQEPPERPNDS